MFTVNYCYKGFYISNRCGNYLWKTGEVRPRTFDGTDPQETIKTDGIWKTKQAATRFLKKFLEKKAGVVLRVTHYVNFRGFMSYRWFIVVIPNGYLYKDGTISSSCADFSKSESGGWYKTRQDARDAIKKWQRLQNVAT